MSRTQHQIASHAADSDLVLADGEVHLWIAQLDTQPAAADALVEKLLSPEERRRAARFANSRDATRWGRSRALLRSILGSYLDADPARLLFVAGEHGKPRFDGDEAWLRFNLSHAAGIAVYAMASGFEVGVDVETEARRVNALAIAERALGEQAARHLEGLAEPERTRRFLRMWVRHEASLKCLGVGLARADGGAGREPFWVEQLDLQGAVVAVAATRAPRRVRRYRWPASAADD